MSPLSVEKRYSGRGKRDMAGGQRDSKLRNQLSIAVSYNGRSYKPKNAGTSKGENNPSTTGMETRTSVHQPHGTKFC